MTKKIKDRLNFTKFIEIILFMSSALVLSLLRKVSVGKDMKEIVVTINKNTNEKRSKKRRGNCSQHVNGTWFLYAHLLMRLKEIQIHKPATHIMCYGLNCLVFPINLGAVNKYCNAKTP